MLRVSPTSADSSAAGHPPRDPTLVDFEVEAVR
jgi:hypothetical protein